uniref:CDI domain-containing protein n=1 Tax=Caenorhabditis japonica TaxID=281687 RepID=A0A8R1HNY9_CAEJA
MSARRCLFGRPTSEQRARTRAWLDNACKQRLEEQCKLWGFDFELGMPLPDRADVEYEFIPASDVPEFYRNKTLSVNTSTSSLDLSSTTLTPLSSPSTSDKDASLLAESNSSFEEVENSKTWKFREPPTPRKSPTKRQQKMTDYMTVTKKLSPRSLTPSQSPSPKNVIFTHRSRRPATVRSPY